MKLAWDETGKRIYETGVDHGVLYPQSEGTYPKGVAWNGLSNVSESPSGADSNAIYADNIKYLDLTSREEFGCTIEAYTYPDEWAICDGSAEPVKGVTIGQQTRKPFGISYRTKIGNDVQGDDYGYKIHLVWNAKAAPSERSYATINDSPEAISFSWEVTTTPINVTNYKPIANMVIDSTKVDAAKLEKLEDILYGTATEDPRLPLPDEVISILKPDTPVTYSISLDKETAEIAPEGTTTITATTVPADATVTWESSSESVATVEDGVVTGVAQGTATITASITDGTNTYSDECAVTVTAG